MSDPTEPPQQTTSKCAKCPAIEQYTSYARLYIIDLVLVVIHFIFLLCMKMSWMLLIPLLLIRVPRLVLTALSRRLNSKKHYDREYNFRRWSTALYFPLAISIEMINMAAYFCVGMLNDCYVGYSVSLSILLVLYQVIDVFLFLSVKKFYEAKVIEFGGNPAAPQMEMPQHNYNGGNGNNMI